MTEGNLIILEGPDGSGKSTLSQCLADRLRADGISVSQFALPGNEIGTLGRMVHELHHNPQLHGIRGIDETSLQILHAAAHVDSIRTRIRPAIERGETVIMDRFWWSTVVYGRATGVDEDTLSILRQLAERQWSFVRPVASFVLLGEHAAVHQSGLEFERLRSAYKTFISELSAPFPVHVLDEKAGEATYLDRMMNGLSSLRRDRPT